MADEVELPWPDVDVPRRSRLGRARRSRRAAAPSSPRCTSRSGCCRTGSPAPPFRRSSRRSSPSGCWISASGSPPHQVPEPDRIDGWRPDLPGRGHPLLPPYFIDDETDDADRRPRHVHPLLPRRQRGGARRRAPAALRRRVRPGDEPPAARGLAHCLSEGELPADHAAGRAAALRRLAATRSTAASGGDRPALRARPAPSFPTPTRCSSNCCPASPSRFCGRALTSTSCSC